MRDVSGVHVSPTRLGFRGFIQILVGGEAPTTRMGATQHPRCMYFDGGDEEPVEAVAEFIRARLSPVRPMPGTGLNTHGGIIGDPPAPGPADRTARPIILAITSNPAVPDPARPGGVAPPLHLDDELNRIRDALKDGAHGRNFELELRPAARVDELVGDLFEYPPTILHFSGHGVVAGLVMTDAGGRAPVLANPEALAHLIMLPRVQANLRALVLNVCLSEQQAGFLAQWAPVVIGTTDAVADSAAVEFAHGFYAGVSNRGSAAECFAAGRASAAMVSPADAALYTLSASVDAETLYFSD